MILAIDTGNTNIVLGCIENRKIRAVARMATDVNKTDYEYAVGMKNVLAFAGFQPESFEGAILSNVVWPLTSTLCRAVKLLTGLDTLVVGKGLKTGLDIRLDDPGQIGADLVVGAVAALHLRRPPLIVIDMGTATTISAVDAQGRFAGGAIVPGLRLSMESLSGNTSQLPRVSLDAPAKCIGTNTVACMQSGAIYGSAALLDGMIERMETELGAPAAVIATGGRRSAAGRSGTSRICCSSALRCSGKRTAAEKKHKNQRAGTEKPVPAHFVFTFSARLCVLPARSPWKRRRCSPADRSSR